MPVKTTKAEIDVMLKWGKAGHSLNQIGFRDPRYASPKDGEKFEAVEVGSTGIHECAYLGKWPDGDWVIRDCGDSYFGTPALVRRPKTSVSGGADA